MNVWTMAEPLVSAGLKARLPCISSSQGSAAIIPRKVLGYK